MDGLLCREKPKEKRRKKALDEKLSPDSLAKSMRDKSGGKVCPLTANPEVMSKFIDSIKELALSELPLVTAYKYNPELKDKTYNTYIEFKIRNISGDDPSKTVKLTLEISLKTGEALALQRDLQIKVIEPLHEIYVNGIKGYRMAFEEETKGGSLRIELFCSFVKGHQEYSLYFICYSKEYSELKADFERVINSFQIE